MTVATTTTDTTAPVRFARTRLVALCALYTLLSLWALVMSAVGPVMAVFGTLPDPSYRFTAMAAGVFKVLTVGAAVAVLVSLGRSTVAVRVLLLGQGVWFVADLLAPEEDVSVPGRLLRLVVSTAVWVGPWLLFARDRSRLWREPLRMRRPLLVLALVSAVPLVAWALANAGADLDPALGADAAELRFDVTAMPLAVLAGLALAALHVRRWWDRVVASCCLVLGALALVHPDAYGAPGRMAGGLVLVGAVVGLAGHLRRRGTRSEGATAAEHGT